MPLLADPRQRLLPRETGANGCFETMRAYRGRIFRLDDHLDRLDASVTYLSTPFQMPRRILRHKLITALARSGLKEAVVRIALMVEPDGEAYPSIVVRAATLPPPLAYARGIRLAVVPARKFSVASIDPQAKYSARLGSVMAVADAQLRHVDEALFMDAMGSVTESTASNLGIVSRGTILTPPCWLGLLAGITRDVLFELAASLRLPIRETPLTRHDLYNAEEAFLTSTLKDVLPVTRIDGRAIGTGRPGPVSKRLLHAFRTLVRTELNNT
ncbi:MAG: aminotransferase class IV family protein [Candidatus Omnitrophica bacterium]|nr:aminotransferase class IV family protein [Candidatus Omnitrophota bacterium]